MADRLFPPGHQVLDGNGDPLAGALLYFYESGTSTPADTYADVDGASANTNPVVADADGRFGAIFGDAIDYKVILKTSGGVTVYTADPVTAVGATAEATQAEVDARTSTSKFVSPAKIADGIGLQGSSIASAAALNLPDVGDYFTVTGTTAITSIESRTAGRRIMLRFADALTLTHDATALILLSGASRTTVAGELVEFVSEGSGNWREVRPLPQVRGALVRKSSNQSIADSTATELTWQTEDRDTDAIHSTSANTDRLTVPSGVTAVRLRANIEWASNGTGVRSVELRKSGSTATGLAKMLIAPSATNAATLMNIASATLTVTAGDYFTIQVFQGSGAALNVVAGLNTWFEMEIVR